MAIGEGLAALVRTGGVGELGFPDLGAYSFERLGRRRRWAEDTARVAERLAVLTLTRHAVARGEVGWSMAELLARAATPETEAELLALARTLTVRGMRAALAEARAAADAEDEGEGAPENDAPEDPEDERRTLQITVDRLTAWAYEATRRFLHAQTGASSDDALVEALLAEAMSTLQTRHPELMLRLDGCGRADAWRQQRELERRLEALVAEEAFGAANDLPDLAERVVDAIDAAARDLPDPPRDPIALDRHLRDVNARLQRRDRRLGALARRLWDADGWRHLGYAGPAQYANERLGCSLASIKARMTLDGLDLLPEVLRGALAGAVEPVGDGRRVRDAGDQARVAYQDVYERERFRCASPVCEHRDLTPHHLVFRSRGGGEGRENLVGLCVRCHLELLHQGRLRAEPPAQHVRWTLGRSDLLVVEGRRRLG
ncbi:MAG: HNH endonuclease [Deltaproteobacteria bacterium]|nr:MAG: HNH endonuclease [Deltaproteobacteria bacterium]